MESANGSVLLICLHRDLCEFPNILAHLDRALEPCVSKKLAQLQMIQGLLHTLTNGKVPGAIEAHALVFVTLNLCFTAWDVFIGENISRQRFCTMITILNSLRVFLHSR